MTLARPTTAARAARLLTALGGAAWLGLAQPALAESTEEKLETLSREVEALKSEVERNRASSDEADRTQIGGYGELHYNNLDSKDEIDFHRFVLFFGHRFTDRVRFNSELEVEHSLVGEGKKGEVELEQAYVDFDLTDAHTARGGLFLVPVGILNETHEPPTFYGVERNPVESNIIPTTWWEGGAALHGRLTDALGYDLAVTSGLNVPLTGANAFSIRSGRQKVSSARANDLAYTGRLKWTGVPGIELAAAAQCQQDIAQGVLSEDIGAALIEAHAIASRGPFAVRALYAQWDLDGDAPKSLGRDEQRGWYVEPSYKITPKLGVFARYNEWDNEAGDGIDSQKEQTDVGLNYWPHPQVVLKVDLQNQSGAVDDDGFNLGVGYMF